jgi:hypothetical protein
MISLLFFYFTWYVGIGFITAFAIDQVIRFTRSSEPYTAKEIIVVILLWPINVLIFLYSFFRSFL